MNARSNDPENCPEAAQNFSRRTSDVERRILELARASRKFGVTQSEVVDAMTEYKPGSITPRFTRLVKRGKLARVRIGTTKPTKASVCGRPRYITRVDEQTRQNVIVHWSPEFAPSNPLQVTAKQDANGLAEQPERCK